MRISRSKLRWIPFLCILIFLILSLGLAYFENESFKKIEVETFFDHDNNMAVESLEKQSFKRVSGTIQPQRGSVWVRFGTPEIIKNWNSTAVIYTGSNEAALYMHAYLVRGKVVEDLGACDIELKSSECRFSTLKYAFPIKVENADENGTVYIKIIPGVNGISDDFYVMKNSYFSRVSIFLTYFLGICSGAFIFIGILFLGLFWILNEKSFLMFGFFYLGLFASLITIRGLWDVFKPSWTLIYGHQMLVFIIISLSIFDLLFLKYFFDFKKNNFRINLLFNSVLGLLWLFLILDIFGFTKEIAWQLILLVIVGSNFLSFMTLVYLISQKQIWSIQIASAWGIGISSISIWAAYRSDLIAGHWFFSYYAILGRLLEAVILNSIGLQKLKMVTERAAVAKAKAEENTIVKALWRTLAHDLSSTTQIIYNSAEIANSSDNLAKTQEHVQRIMTTIQHQAEIIKHAKNTYLIRGGNIISLNPKDLKKSTTEAIQICHFLAERKGIRIHVDFPEESILVMAEQVSLTHQVLVNLIENAIKFTDYGKSIYISITNIQKETVTLSIKDEGIGIPDSLKERLFDEEQPVTRPSTDDKLGAGLGLLIVKDFLAAYGAKLEILDADPNGTEVLIHFKRA